MGDKLNDHLPGDILIGAMNNVALRGWATDVLSVPGHDPGQACVARPPRDDEPACVWVDPYYPAYRDAWRDAAQAGLVDPLSNWGEWVDVDHVYPRSWAKQKGLRWVRLFPVWAEVNRSAGGGRERMGDDQTTTSRRGTLVYAHELQLMKILGHPVGKKRAPESL